VIGESISTLGIMKMSIVEDVDANILLTG